MAVDEMRLDVDMDMDIDLDYDGEEVDLDITRLKAEAAALEASGNGGYNEATNGVEEAAEDGEVDVHALVAKIHVRGVNSFGPQDAENYAREHYSDELFGRVEWVDDTSINLVYDTELAAEEALLAFSAEEVMDPLEFRPAKRLTTHPQVELFVRRATVSDVKVRGAHKHSRFYLNNPKYDPELRMTKRRPDDRGYRTRDYGLKRRRRDMEDDRTSRRGSQGEPWNEDLYDDDPVSVAARKERTNSYSSAENGRKRARVTEELFPDRASGRLRNRSASPARDGDGRFGFGEEQPARRTARPRSQTPPERRRNATNGGARDDLRKELFPDKKPAAPSALTNGHSNGAVELFPNHGSPPKTPRELFPNHKRHDARDFDREYRQVEQAVGRYSLDGADERGTHRRADNRKQHDSQPRGDLMARISGGRDDGRLQSRPKSSEGDVGFSFKGAGSGGSFCFKGASKGKAAESGLVKELFPMKAGDGGGDLFEGRIKGRGNQRRRAEDLF
ncbi:hypothetical protein B0A54_01312 [Friedmanniomyces endolithicus]|uniref:Uncharacterized protein n=1 Tax=Friedmanniomyces endolithicus TaxID=329885 RepID=A0A4U0VL84_9PEZI|nr:hypothetical protein LTS09_004653 [Friedmanniomyces endolithicus]KAK0313534.1 hypothetical protein LTR01_001790 [Friedmanniomyces endolithicus]KAK0830324.1 hypothetical protein LTR73_003602 [Friedmanniomyces endolithicus]TKA49235.1 hypothetical protein B0A54_01312 [Friedmanniomyces endolithicus]